ncbi:MAG: CatB-related O-acetyltransferase [Sphingobacteriales bacterium]|nr:CatB-related O-acetyltransferase [Sphingobacteriales bacterium]MBD3822039.1 CatB-related O-acetyltransferase [Thiotrichales bacterium]
MKNFIEMLFSKKEKLTERERKRIRDRSIRFKGGKPTDVEVGEHTYINGLTVFSWGLSSKVSIGKYCSIADSVTFIAGGEHHKDWVSTFPFMDRWKIKEIEAQAPGSSKGDIVIGHDVWIGHGATVLSGVTIGHGAIIGAMAVVAKNVPPYAIVVGNPAKIIKYRFTPEFINTLLTIKWWDWPEEQVEKEQGLFTKPDLFIAKYNQPI